MTTSKQKIRLENVLYVFDKSYYASPTNVVGAYRFTLVRQYVRPEVKFCVQVHIMVTSCNILMILHHYMHLE